MPNAGEIEVHVTRRTIGAVAIWLTVQHVPLATASLAVSVFADESAQSRLDELVRLADLLQKAALRKRAKTLFTINIPRGQAEALVSAIESSVVAKLELNGSVHRALAQFRAAIRSRRGRRTLTGIELAARSRSGSSTDPRYKSIDDARHRKRLVRRDRWERAIDEWLQGLADRGEAILTTTAPPPKF
jgi:hypothetical protein